MVDYARLWSDKAEIPLKRFISWLSVAKSKFYAWIERYGKANEHNAQIPRDFWLEFWEREAIIKFAVENPLEGYRRLTFMMLDHDIVAVSPSSTWRVLSQAGLLQKWNSKKSLKGTGFVQPLKPHEHWHVDVSYLNICGTFYYLCSLLDGCSRYIVHWEIREQMTETDVEIILQRAKEKFPEARPRIISDNGPLSPDDARRMVQKYISYYNNTRLHSAISYVTPLDKLEGRDIEIFKERDMKLEAVREQRKQ